MGACNSNKNNEVADQETTIDQMAMYGDIPQGGVQGAGFQPAPVDRVQAAPPSVQFLNPAMDPSAQFHSASSQFVGTPFEHQAAPAPSVQGGVALGSQLGDVGVIGTTSMQFRNTQWDTMSQAQVACDQYNQKYAYPGSSLFQQGNGQVHTVPPPNGTVKYLPGAAVVMNPSAGFASDAVKQPTPGPNAQPATPGHAATGPSEFQALKTGKASSGKTSSKAKKSKAKKKKKSSKSKKSKSSKSKKSKSKK